jgi:arginyl-tRNA synthetase
MKTLLFLVREQCTKAITKAFPQLSADDSQAEVTICKEGHADYQCNSALKLAKILHLSPRDIAQQIISLLQTPLCSKIELAGSGFINFWIKPEILQKELDAILRDPRLGVEIADPRKRVVVDFSYPNIAKELHVGHLRSTIIGDSIARLLEFLGYDVLRLNHVGDWGSQFGMLIAYLKQEQPDVLSGKKTADLSTFTLWYKQSKKLCDDDPEFKKRAQQEVVALQSGQKESLACWELICKLSRIGFNEIYSLLDVTILERGESFYNPFLKDLISDLEKKDLIQISNGAKCVFPKGFVNRDGEPLPLMVQKSDGGFNYDTTDLAGFRHRIGVEKATWIIIVTDAGQSLHFQLVYQSAVLAKYLDPAKIRFDHVPFGVVLGPDGKKFKTRSGETEKLIDLLTEAVKRAKKVLLEHTKGENFSDEEIDEISKVLGIDAIKYADLSSNRVRDYVFSYDRMLKFEGNTAAFLLYAYVRILGIMRKTKANPDEILKSYHITLGHPSEIALGLHLRRFSEVLETITEDLLPNHLADYLYVLAEKFNSFFRDCRVEGSPEEKSRLALCELTGRILKQGLFILGLKTVSKM